MAAADDGAPSNGRRMWRRSVMAATCSRISADDLLDDRPYGSTEIGGASARRGYDERSALLLRMSQYGLRERAGHLIDDETARIPPFQLELRQQLGLGQFFLRGVNHVDCGANDAGDETCSREGSFGLQGAIQRHDDHRSATGR